MRTLFALLMLFAAASAEAEGTWNVKTGALEGTPDGNGMIVLHWAGEIFNNGAEETVLHAVLELRDADGVPLKQFETSAVTVTGYGSQVLEDNFLVSPDVWNQNRSTSQWAERSDKRPVNWERPWKAKRVELYGTSWCSWCKIARMWLDQNRVKYRDYDVEHDRRAAARFRQLGGRGGVPTLVVDGSIAVEGWSERSYRELFLPKEKSTSTNRVQPMPRTE